MLSGLALVLVGEVHCKHGKSQAQTEAEYLIVSAGFAVLNVLRVLITTVF